jgi:hypothetical protein
MDREKRLEVLEKRVAELEASQAQPHELTLVIQVDGTTIGTNQLKIPAD